MLAVVTGVYEGTESKVFEGKQSVKLILNQFGQDSKIKVKPLDGAVLPKLGDTVTMMVEIRSGVYNNRPYLALSQIKE